MTINPIVINITLRNNLHFATKVVHWYKNWVYESIKKERKYV